MRALETDRDYQRLLETISKGGGIGGLGGYSPPLFTALKKLKKPCWLAKLSGLKHINKADSDYYKKTLAHYNSYL